MRFLCLHGMGTNSRIFEAQTAAIRYGLGSLHTYEYVDGALPTAMAPGVGIISGLEDEYLQSLYEKYAATATAGQDKQFPRHITIFDSAPSTNFRVSKAVAFFTVNLSPIQRIIAAPFLYLAAAGWTLVLWLRLTADIQTRSCNHHNRRDLVSEARRTYIYTDTDAIVHPDDVEQHAREAEKAGYTVRREKFVASGHVSHSRKDATRYWGIVTSTWDGSYPAN
ncbi:unnamed protein product [Clonostachys solani]|uniref:Serine hydrolase domain-containing protein n=1 Tax=Clonostachys solani TaxID=160281 RepID=A0A9P0ETM9_9HYPO|nr:unnamed protein product [Clonostachys solani]